MTNASDTERITIRIPEELASVIDEAISYKDFRSRSDFLEASIRFGIEWTITTIANEARSQIGIPTIVWVADNHLEEIANCLLIFDQFEGTPVRLTAVIPSGLNEMIGVILKPLKKNISSQNLIRAYLIKYLDYYTSIWLRARGILNNPSLEFRHKTIKK